MKKEELQIKYRPELAKKMNSEKHMLIIPNFDCTDMGDVSKEDAMDNFVSGMDGDMNAYFSIKESVLEKKIENENGTICKANIVNPNLFNFYILKRRGYIDGTSLWNLCCELRDNHDKYMVLDSIRGSKEEALRALEQFVLTGERNKEKTKEQSDSYER